MNYRISSACRRGASHRAADAPCQDRVCTYSNEAVVCAALADGAGSRLFSDEGAELVTRLVSRHVGREFDELYEMGGDAVAELLIDKCMEMLLGGEYDPEEYACTLLFFAGHADGRYISGHLGDGVQILIDGRTDEPETFSKPENGLYRNETYFVTSGSAKRHLRIKKGVLERGGALLLMSDGPAELLYGYDEGVPAEECRLIPGMVAGDADEADAMLDKVLERMSEKCFDDLSIAVITWKED